jgi:DNA-binding MarR family transcriptional regulator
MLVPLRSTADRIQGERGPRSPAVLTWILLVRAYLKIDRLIEQRLRTLGLTSPQFGLLNQLSHSHGPTQQECSRALHIDKANVSGILDRLSRTGLVERLPDPVDRRYNRIYLTARGRDVLAAARAEVDTVLRGVFDRLNGGERARLQALLGHLHRSLE